MYRKMSYGELLISSPSRLMIQSLYESLISEVKRTKDNPEVVFIKLKHQFDILYRKMDRKSLFKHSSTFRQLIMFINEELDSSDARALVATAVFQIEKQKDEIKSYLENDDLSIKLGDKALATQLMKKLSSLQLKLRQVYSIEDPNSEIYYSSSRKKRHDDKTYNFFTVEDGCKISLTESSNEEYYNLRDNNGYEYEDEICGKISTYFPIKTYGFSQGEVNFFNHYSLYLYMKEFSQNYNNSV